MDLRSTGNGARRDGQTGREAAGEASPRRGDLACPVAAVPRHRRRWPAQQIAKKKRVGEGIGGEIGRAEEVEGRRVGGAGWASATERERAGCDPKTK